jgi:hypothetical protein
MFAGFFEQASSCRVSPDGDLYRSSEQKRQQKPRFRKRLRFRFEEFEDFISKANGSDSDQSSPLQELNSSLLYGCPYPSLNVRVRGTAVRNALCQARLFSPCFGSAPETHLSTFCTVLCSSMPPLPVIHQVVLLSVP